MTTDILRLDQVSYRYPGRSRAVAVDGITLGVEAGRNVGIVGESGAGKTTLLRLLLGLAAPTTGRVLFRGEPLPRDRRSLQTFRRAVQIVFQDPVSSLDPRMPVGTSIAEPLRGLRPDLDAAQRTARVAELMRQVGLDPATARRYPHQFSGGQRQRIAIARALAPEPKVLIGDEPLSALDVSVRAQVIDLLRELCAARGTTLVLVSHDLGVVSQLSDQLAVMRHGSIVEAGPAVEVLNAPEHPYTRQLLDAVVQLP